MRKYITAVLTDSMLQQLRMTDGIVEIKPVNVQDLIGLDFINALRSKALVNTLRELGVDVDVNNIKVELLPGDVLYVVNPGVLTHQLDDDDHLPEHAVITVTAYKIYSKQDYIKDIFRAWAESISKVIS